MAGATDGCGTRVVDLSSDAARKRISELERKLGEMILALEYERTRIRQPSVSGGTALARARAVLGI